jgi:hypothetical protein
VDTALVLTLPQDTIDSLAGSESDSISTNKFLLKATYRMKAKELFYFDHPLFGMLVQITPVKNA